MTHTAPAGFWRRYAAYSLDAAVLGGASTFLAWPRLVAGSRETAAAFARLSDLLGRVLADALMQGATPAQVAAGLPGMPAVQAGAAAVQAGIVHTLAPWLAWYALLAMLYHVGFERSAWSASPGKHLLGLRVVDARGDGRPSLAQTLVRHFAGALSWLTLNLGHALAAVPPHKRALHDYLARARVLGPAARRLPAWARAWLALQVLAGVVLSAWLLQRYVAALRASLA
jgi:uncharacterized RDD family membrane protein YckC